ncbi:hypothetical protein [Salsipaludibacter albus]|uniref:hypothetical protein n=1 Tax=Salsipaludibacter albus TaxID=2849650 RepID=UPI001EE459DB|nr:hypothetical protein [Salsipaludibacter albus]MBY5161074.1 hypothetical protein [Salsipaludibacter albus]
MGTSGMTRGRIVALVTGCVLALPGLGMLFGGAGLLVVTAAPGEDGFATSTVSMSSPRAAITSDEVTFHLDAAAPDWLADVFRTDVRMDVVTSDPDAFVGVGPTDDVEAWLDGAAVDHVTNLTGGEVVVTPGTDGTATIASPLEQDFWVASTTTAGDGFDWTVTDGRWTVVAATTDGQPGIDGVLDVGVRTAFLRPLATFLTVAGALVGLGALGLVLGAILGGRGRPPQPPDHHLPPVRDDEVVRVPAIR